MLTSWKEIREKYDNLEEYLLREGELKGKREGRLQGMRDFLLNQLEKRFGVLPARYARRIEKADDAQLQLWGERVLTAEKLREIFA